MNESLTLIIFSIITVFFLMLKWDIPQHKTIKEHRAFNKNMNMIFISFLIWTIMAFIEYLDEYAYIDSKSYYVQIMLTILSLVNSLFLISVVDNLDAKYMLERKSKKWYGFLDDNFISIIFAVFTLALFGIQSSTYLKALNCLISLILIFPFFIVPLWNVLWERDFKWTGTVLIAPLAVFMLFLEIKEVQSIELLNENRVTTIITLAEKVLLAVVFVILIISYEVKQFQVQNKAFKKQNKTLNDVNKTNTEVNTELKNVNKIRRHTLAELHHRSKNRLSRSIRWIELAETKGLTHTEILQRLSLNMQSSLGLEELLLQQFVKKDEYSINYKVKALKHFQIMKDYVEKASFIHTINWNYGNLENYTITEENFSRLAELIFEMVCNFEKYSNNNTNENRTNENWVLNIDMKVQNDVFYLEIYDFDMQTKIESFDTKKTGFGTMYLNAFKSQLNATYEYTENTTKGLTFHLNIPIYNFFQLTF